MPRRPLETVAVSGSEGLTTVLNISRGGAAVVAALQAAYPGPLEEISKTRWKQLTLPRILLELRRIRTTRLLLIVDDTKNIQDEWLFRVMASVSRAPQTAFWDAATGTMLPITRAGTLAAVPVIALRAVGALGILGAVLLLLLVLSVLAVSRRRPTGSQRATRLVMYLRSTLELKVEAGGSVAHTLGIIQAFVEDGHDVHVVTNEERAWLAVPGTRQTILPRTRFLALTREIERVVNGFYFAQQALPIIRQHTPDVLYQRKGHFDLSGVLLSRLTGIPLVLECNEQIGSVYWQRPRLLWLAQWIERIQVRHAMVSVAVSDVLKMMYNEAGFSTRRMIVVPNGVRADDFDTIESNRHARAIRAQYGIPENALVIGFVGTFGQWHGTDTMAEALVLVAREFPQMHALLIGDGELRNRAYETVNAAGLTDRVIFTGLVPRDRVPAYMAACDVLLSPHAASPDGKPFFGSPTKLFEYMAARRALVASALDQISDVLEDGVTARLVPPGQADALAAGISDILRDRETRQVMAAQARHVVERQYTWRSNIRQVLIALDGQLPWISNRPR
jgi:glycosyltransferase involved in cell wall biosynthesis